jgi:predicted component of type VI protein secretion system
MKKLTAYIFSLFMTISLLSGCSNSSPEKKNSDFKNEITLYTIIWT